MDLVYERALGGIDGAADCTVRRTSWGEGSSASDRLTTIHGKPLPNLEDPSALSSPGTIGQKCGVLALGPRLMPRSSLWNTPQPARPSGARVGLAFGFQLCVLERGPPDLQVEGYLKGNEEVELENLSADSPSSSVSLAFDRGSLSPGGPHHPPSGSIVSSVRAIRAH